jgi:hypothetical protein
MNRTTVAVSSRDPWVDTGVTLISGDKVTFSASGRWFDWIIPCTADGYIAKPLYSIHRPPRILDDGRYFRLMGCILQGKPGDCYPPEKSFVIGQSSSHVIDTTGKLYVFANDRCGYYWNNWGSITLIIDCLR